MKTMSFFIMQMCSSLRTIFYGIKVVPLTTLAALRIFPDLITYPIPCNAMDIVFLPFYIVFYIFINIHEYANWIIFI